MSKTQVFALPIWPSGRFERSVFSVILTAVLAAALILSLVPASTLAQTATVPVAPSGLSGSLVNNGSSVNLSWTDNSADETEFKLYERTFGNTSWYLRQSYGVNTLSVQIIAPSAAGIYEYIVRACNVSGCSPDSNIATVTVSSSGGSNVPAAPTSLRQTSSTASSITLTWNDNSTNEDKFNLERKLASASTYSFVAQVGTNITTYTDTSVTAGSSYDYRVQACQSGYGCSDYTYVYSVSPNSSTSSTSCTGLTLTFTNNKTSYVQGENVNYTWTCTPGGTATSVTVQVVDPAGTATTYNSFSGSASTMSLGFSTSNLSPGGYTLRACFISTCSPVTVSAAFSVTSSSSGTGDVPAAPTGLTAQISGSNVNLTWTDNSSNEAGFKIYRGPTWTDIGNVAANVTTFTDASRPAGTYIYRVNAFNSSFVYSGISNDVSVTIGGSTTTDVTAPVISSGSVRAENIMGPGAQVKWSTNENSSSRVEYGTAAGSYTLSVDGDCFGTSPVIDHCVNLTGLTSGTRYYYRVKSVDAAGNYIYSAENSFTAGDSTSDTATKTYSATLTGTITDSSGRAIGSVGVHVFTKDNSLNFGTTSNSDGSYLINLPAGTYEVELFPSYDRKDLIKPAIQSVDIKENEIKRFNYQFTLTTQVSKIITGSIKFSNGVPVTDAQVGAYNETTNYWSDTVTDSLGNYKLMVSSGQYKVSFRPQNPATATWQWPGIFQDVNFSGDAMETKVLNFTVPLSENQLIVKTVDESGAVISNAGVSLDVDYSAGSTGSAQFKRVDALGKAVFFAAPGKYSVRGHLPTELGYVNPPATLVELLDGKTLEITLVFRKLKLDTSVTISGTVVFDNGSPAAGAFLWGWSELGGNAYGRTNDQGQFSLTIPSKSFWRLGAGKEVDGFPYKSAEITINTEFETSDITLILVKYSANALPKRVEVVKTVTETIVAKAEDGAQVVVPPQAAGSTGTVNVAMKPTIEVSSQANAKIVGTVWDVDVKDQTGTAIKEFADEIEITFPYDEDKLKSDGVSADVLKPKYYDEATGAWVEVTDYTLDKDSKSFVIRVKHLTRFALVAPADITPPATPSEFVYQLTGPVEVTLTWVDPKADFHHTRVNRTENKTDLGSILSELVTGSRYVDSAVTVGKTYYYYLEAVDAAGNSSKASELLKVTVTGGVSSPSTPAASGVSPDKYPSGLLFKYADNPTVYLLKNGIKYPITDYSVYKNHVSGSRSIVTIPSSVTFESGNHVTLKSGTLIKPKSDATVYLVIENKKRPFTSAEEFLGLGYRFHQIQTIDDTAVAAMETTGDLARPSGTVFKYAGNAAIYFLEDGKKRGFPSLAVLKAWIDPTYVITIADSEVYSDGTGMGLPSGVLVKGTTATIYGVFDSTLRPFASSNALTNLGFKTSQVIKVSSSDLKLHSVGESIK